MSQTPRETGSTSTAQQGLRPNAPPRRWRDTAVLAPLLGTLLLMPPLIGLAVPVGPILGVPAIVIYVFGVWALLILVTARASAALCRVGDACGGRRRSGP